jgi:hypothetical protein
MEFYDRAWDQKLLEVLKANPRSITCFQTKVLNKGRQDVNGGTPLKTCGAGLTLNEKKPFDFDWLIGETVATGIIETPLIMGATYGASKEYWERIHGLKGLKEWGSDELMLSMKVWREGGRCLLISDIAVGHIYRNDFPYVNNEAQLTSNKLFIMRMMFDPGVCDWLEGIMRVTRQPVFDEAILLLDKNLLKTEREYLNSISEHPMEYFLAKNIELSNNVKNGK